MKTVADRADQDLARYQEAMRLIVEDDAIQDGAATFRGTRILVHQIADLIGQGADEAELREDYARAHPCLGRPRKPGWRGGNKADETEPQGGR